MELRWGLVGLGALAELLAPAFAASRNGRLVACASRSYEQAQRFGRDHGVDRVHATFQELVRDPAVDAVYVATPNHLHTPVVLAAAAAGKHVLCEKPMAPTAGEAEEMIEACRAAGVMLRVGFYLRFQQVLRTVREAVRQGRIGEVRELTVQRASVQPPVLAPWRRELATAGAGVLADVGIHLIDLAHWILGEPITRVFALAYPPRSTGRPDDSATVVLEFADGCQAIVRCHRGLPAVAGDLQLFGTRGMLVSGPLRWVDSYRLALRSTQGNEDWEFPTKDCYRLQIEGFADELSGGPTMVSTGEEGLLMVHLAEAAIQSLETGTAVSMEGLRTEDSHSVLSPQSSVLAEEDRCW